MVNVLRAIIDLWLDQDPEDSDNYQLWTAWVNLENLRSGLLGTNPCEEEDFGSYYRIYQKAF